MVHLPIPHWPIAHWDTGRYAAFVAAAYGVSALALIGLTAQTLLSAWRWRRQAQRTRRP